MTSPRLISLNDVRGIDVDSMDSQTVIETLQGLKRRLPELQALKPHEVDDIPSLGDGPARDILQNIVTFAGKIGTPITRTASTGGKIGSTGA